MFCEEFDTQGHYQLKHKGLQVLVMECDDEEKIEELVDSVSVVLVQKEKQATDQEHENAKDKLADYCSLPNEYQDDSALLIKSSNDIELLLAHEFSDSQRSVLSLSELVQCISGRDDNEEKHCVCLSQVERIWEPGWLPAKAIQLYWPGIRQQLYRPEICQSLWFSAVVTDTRLKRQLHIQLKELLLEFQDVPRLLFGSSEFSTKIHKPPDQNKKCEAELEMYMHHSFKTQKLCVVYHCSEMEFSGFKRLHEMGLHRNPELVHGHITEALFSHFLACGILLVSCSNLQALLVSYSRRCQRMIYLDSIGFAITRRWLSVVHLLCSMGISPSTAVLWNRKTRKKRKWKSFELGFIACKI